MSEASDETLFRAWREGDGEAGNELAVRYAGAVRRFFSNKVPEVADDLTQRTFLACMTARVEEVRSFRALMFGIARKQLLRHFEGRGLLKGEEMMSRISLAAMVTTPTQKIDREQTQALINRALATLPIDFQIALELRYWKKLSSEEIGQAVGLSAAGVRTRLRRARVQLREQFEALSEGKPLPGFGTD